ncbi:hypothetical protein BC355_17610 [Vibrio cholerae]|uniref:Type-F conjugative transfer system pilin assembly protein TraF n=1 Tax=Vibrio cholerae TaxID=666 RepID=A0A395TEN9_VIBCL|nr:conjugal transfer protein TraF [Vibrio cholerae]EGR0468619.1 hypothetical protein [Vibrio cholerae]RGP82976.1 hypothetical protein BC355_17610 [Vibrio cholerae]RGP83316.1 hypothetical protein BC353_17570 [Vibrio cholerae]TXY52083.1 hypothetical protein FXE74_19090 [Vibrio cholerae]GIB31716.1 conjugal transfer protein TraF [Vibrio cholerae]
MKRLLTPVLIGIALSASTAYAQNKQVLSNEVKSENPYYKDSERGWFWYEQLTDEQKEIVDAKIIEQMQPSPSTEPFKDEVKPLSNKWFRDNFQNYADAAMNNPHDKEAMRTYLYLEKFMRDRAMAFGIERQKAVMAEPFLDATSTRPIANFGMKTMNIQASQNKDLLISQLAKESGLYFFYRSGDAFVTQQADLLAILRNQHEFTILPVSLDGTPPPEVLGTEFQVDSEQSQAKMLGIQVLPAIYIFNPKTKSVELVSQGLHSLTSLKDRIIYAALRGGIIDDQQFQLTRPTGLYTNPNGYISGSLEVPIDAPYEFIKLYNESQK